MSSRLFSQTLLISRIATRTYPATTRTIIFSRAGYATHNENKNEVISKATELKDQVLGSLKENIGYAIGNKNLEDQGRNQRESTSTVSKENPVRNRTDYDQVKSETKSNLDYVSEKAAAAKDQVVSATKEDANYISQKTAAAKETLENLADKAASVKDQVVDSAKQNLGTATETAASVKDQVIGSVKENFGTAVEKASSIKDQAANKAASIKDQVVGTAKENIGYVSGNSTLETEGKIQKTIATDKVPIDKASVAEKAASAKEHIVGKAQETVGNWSGNDAMVNDAKKRLSNADKINADKIAQKNGSSQKKNP